MTEPTHHLTPQLLMAYSAGTLPEAFDLIVASHVSLCDTCRAELASYDAVGGALLEAETDGFRGIELDASSRSDVLAAIRNEEPAAPAPAPAPKCGDPRVPTPLAPYVVGGLDTVKWRSVGMGVKQSILPTAPGATARLLYIPAGTAVPDHGHNGTEVTLVLKGAFEDEDGRFARGDVEVATEELNHTPVADISEDCICLAVTDAPLRFKGLLPRLAQPFLKI